MCRQIQSVGSGIQKRLGKQHSIHFNISTATISSQGGIAEEKRIAGIERIFQPLSLNVSNPNNRTSEAQRPFRVLPPPAPYAATTPRTECHPIGRLPNCVGPGVTSKISFFGTKSKQVNSSSLKLILSSTETSQESLTPQTPRVPTSRPSPFRSDVQRDTFLGCTTWALGVLRCPFFSPSLPSTAGIAAVTDSWLTDNDVTLRNHAQVHVGLDQFAESYLVSSQATFTRWFPGKNRAELRTLPFYFRVFDCSGPDLNEFPEGNQEQISRFTNCMCIFSFPSFGRLSSKVLKIPLARGSAHGPHACPRGTFLTCR